MSDDNPLERLLAVQDEDTAIDQLTHRRAHLPERTALDAHGVTVRETETRRSALAEQRAERARALKRLQDEVASIEARVAEVHRSLHSGAVTAPRDLQALQHEEESLRRRQDHLETEELELMEELDPLEEEVGALDERLVALTAEREALTGALRQAEVDVEEELTAVLARRQTAVDGVPDELLATYESLRGSLGGVAVARLVGKVCGGCHLGLSAVEVDRIRREPPDAMVRCEECGRLLVR